MTTLNEKHEIQKAVIYCRVSTKEQVEEGNSLVTQERLCREYAKRHNFEVDQVFIELGESARTAERTQLKKLMAYCTAQKNRIRAVIVYKIDRLSRNLSDYAQIRYLLKRHKVEIKSTQEQFEDTPSGRFLENIIANVAQFDNEQRGERALHGLKEAVREGRYVWSAPFGYSNVKVNEKSTIAPNKFAEYVKIAFELLAEGKYTIEAVRKMMHEHGSKINLKLSKPQFNRLIRNKLYTGHIIKFGEDKLGAFKPIISEELFEKVQAVINKKSGKRGYSMKHPEFPLRQFCYSAYGTRLSGGFSRGKSGKRYPYYFFKTEFINLRRDDIDNLFIKFLDGYRFNPDDLKLFRSILRTKLKLFFAKADVEEHNLQNNLNNITASENVLVDKMTTGKLSDEVFQKQMERLSREKNAIQLRIDAIPKSESNFDKLYFAIKDFLAQPGTFWRNAKIETKINIQGFNFPKGFVYDKKKIRTLTPPLFRNALTSIPSPLSLNAGHPFLRLNTPKVGSSKKQEKELGILDYFTEKELQEIQEYVDFLLEMGRSIGYEPNNTHNGFNVFNP